MQPFFIFAGILLVIWTLSAIATWANKQQDAERRRRVREQMARAGITPQQPARRISPGIAARFPDVLAPPQIARRAPVRQAPRPAPVRAPMKKHPPRPAAKPARRAAANVPQAIVRQAPVAQQQQPQHTTMAQLAAAPAMVARSASAAPGLKANATVLGRWLRPATLQQQFILTEIFQPPIALRPQRWT
jgi:hypothetical protein